jgi:hypothetical protein
MNWIAKYEINGQKSNLASLFSSLKSRLCAKYFVDEFMVSHATATAL